jgi:mannose-P-dolichol utilization defect protein 1
LCDHFLNSIEVLLGYAIGVATNFTILSQILMYQKPQAAKEKKVK